MKNKYLPIIWQLVAVTGVGVACYVSNASWFISLLSLVGVLFVLGVALQKSYSQLLGAVFCVLLAYLAYDNKIYANAVVNVILAPVSVYGYFYWKKRKEKGCLSKSLKKSHASLILTITVALTLITGMCTVQAGGNFPILDALTGVLPVVATLLMILAYKEQWYCWILYNLLQVGLWFMTASLQPEVMAIFILKIIFFINSVIGFYNWKSTTN